MQAQVAEVKTQDQQNQNVTFKSHIEFEAKSTRDKDSNQIDGHESEIEFKFYAMKTKNFGFLVSTKLNNTIREGDDHAQDVIEYAVGIRDNRSWFDQPIKLEFCYFWLREPAELIQLSLKHKANLSLSTRLKTRFQFNQTIKSIDEKFERHAFKFELSPVYEFGPWGVGPQIKISQKGWLTRDEYTFSVLPFVKYELDHLEIMLRQSFNIAQMSQKKSEYSWQQSSVTSLQVELDF